MHGKKVYACLHDHIQVRTEHGGLRFKVKESWVDTLSGDTRVLGNSNRVLKKFPSHNLSHVYHGATRQTLAP
jgi:hypothetical protein